MSATKCQLTEEKYLFTFQDETQLWIPRKFIEKYPQLPFHDIIKHSEKYEDGSHYIDMLPFHIKKVISFFMDKNQDISSLNLRDSYDIYRTLLEYSVTLDKEIQSDLLFHIEELFIDYLNANNYTFFKYLQYDYCQINIPMELFDLEKKEMHIQGLFSPQRKDELFYYSILIKMMNITEVEITYDYASNIPIEYICPSCIKDLFTSLEKLAISVTSNYKKSKIVLNPNSDEYKMEYNRLFNSDEYKTKNFENYDHYAESEMYEYNKVYLDVKTIDSNKLVTSINGKRRMKELPKLYKYIPDDAIYTNDYSEVEISQMNDKDKEEEDRVNIYYRHYRKESTFTIDKFSSEWGISQLLRLFSYLNVSTIERGHYNESEYKARIILKILEEGVFDSLSILSVKWIRTLTERIDYSLLMKVMTTHIFPNVTELIYDDESFPLSSIKKECFPKLHIINYNVEITYENFEYLFPMDLMSIIDTITIINKLIYNLPHSKELLEKDLISIYELKIDTSNGEIIKKLDYFENYKHNIDRLDIQFNDNMKDNGRNSLERFLKSSLLQHLKELNISFEETISLEYLTWISSVFNGNKINFIDELMINLSCIQKDSSSEYLTVFEDIMANIIPKASIVTIDDCSITVINRLIGKGCFHNTTELSLFINDIPDESFYELYTIDNFPKLKSIIFRTFRERDWWNDFIQKLCTYINHGNFPLSNKTINEYEIETLFDYIYNEEHLSKLINFITARRIPRLKEFVIHIDEYIPDEHINSYKQQLIDSMFIQENHVYYKFD
ncbi:hypothetical protein WA158_004890 [Blastocystis sp. Blastoise]